MRKTSNLYTRIEPEIKEQAEKILYTLGISSSSAINLFYKQIILHKGIPFDLKIPREKPLCLGSISEEELHEELEKGFADVQAGRVKSAEKVFEELRKDYQK